MSHGSQEILLKKLQISLKDIESAIENFSEKNCVGSGELWKAYKGELPLDSDTSTAFGYLDPQHKQGFLTKSSDIYSIRVVLFEILCGRLAWAEDCKDHAESLGPLAKRFYEERNLMR
ncbi:putative non-specific serine/threonine protein kinase [Helianthus anomalus]